MTMPFPQAYSLLALSLLHTEPIHTGEWQSQNTSKSAAHATYELMNVNLDFRVPIEIGPWQADSMPSLPWAEEHFQERVSGVPWNPPPSHVRWPWARSNANADHMTASAEKFSHTYPERFWPRYDGGVRAPEGFGAVVGVDPYDNAQYYVADPEDGRIVWKGTGTELHEHMLELGGERSVRQGIRYRYGDLQDVVDLLVRSPLTRQAYLPVWFPEDTGNHMAERVPCTLGYHFMIRDGKLHCWYAMRSCDIIRHLRNDVYMAGRLMQWVATEIAIAIGIHPGVEEEQCPVPGTLHMTISSLHAFAGDKWRLEQISGGNVETHT